MERPLFTHSSSFLISQTAVLATVIATVSACSRAEFSSNINQDITPEMRFSANEISAVSSGTIVVKRYGKGGDLPVTTLPVVDHTGTSFGNNYDVAVEVKGFFAVGAGMTKEQCSQRIISYLRDVESWSGIKRGSSGKQVYSLTKRVDASGKDLSGYTIPTSPLTSAPEQHYLRAESEIPIATVKFFLSSTLTLEKNGSVRDTVFNFSPIVGQLLGVNAEFVKTNDFRNLTEIIPHANGFLFYSVGKVTAAHDAAKLALNPTVLEPGNIGVFNTYKDVCSHL